jgi:RNA polymerase sigma-70 factor (ECF subfamily)
MDMGNDADWRRFEQLALPHLNAAYNLAMWLTRNADDAQDVVQEALLRAMRYIDGLRLESARPWLLQIVRHTCYSWLRANRPAGHVSLDDTEDTWPELATSPASEPPAIAIRRADRQQINDAIAALPVAYREVFVLRELEDLSYLEIARIAEIPIGTVMSRLARARGLMRNVLAPAARPVLRTVGRPAQGGVGS